EMQPAGDDDSRGRDSGKPRSIEARGLASYQADLAQLRRWFQDPRARQTWNLVGRLSGEASDKTADGVTTAQIASQIDQFVIAELTPTAPGGPNAPGNNGMWREEKLTFNLNGAYNSALDVLTVA